MFVLPLSYPLPRRALRPAWNGSAQHLFDDTDAPQRPAMDAAESDTGYTLTFDLPGMSKQNVRVTIERREVRVEASQEAATATTNDGVRVLRRERHTPRFARTVQLPVEVDAAAATARFENGVLTVTLVKRAPETATVVNVQ